MIRVALRDPDDAAAAVRERRRRFGLDTPLPADPRVVERAVLRHLAERRPAALVLRMSRPFEIRGEPGSGVNLEAGVPELCLLLPEGRVAFLAIRAQAQVASRAERAFADLCRTRSVALHVVRSLPEARRALDTLGIPTIPETHDAIPEGGVSRQPAPGTNKAWS